MNKHHYPQLDVFRALAALSVCAVHFNFDSFFYNHFANGLFVQLFFALSGFLFLLLKVDLSRIGSCIKHII